MTGARRAAGDGGFTLIELVVAVAIMGIAMVFIVAGMTTSIFASDVHRRQSTAETVIRDFAEYVTNAAYVTCAGTPTYATGFASVSGYAAQVTAVTYLNNPLTDTAFSPTCSSSTALQKLSLKVSDTSGRDSETLDLVKRSP